MTLTHVLLWPKLFSGLIMTDDRHCGQYGFGDGTFFGDGEGDGGPETMPVAGHPAPYGFGHGGGVSTGRLDGDGVGPGRGFLDGDGISACTSD